MFDDVYWIYEDNPSFKDMISAFLVEFSQNENRDYVGAELQQYDDMLNGAFERGEYPKQAIIPQQSGSYVTRPTP